MRRLFSAFADGAPGLGLLLLRVAAAAWLGAPALQMAIGRPPGLGIAASLLYAGDGLLLAVGLWTPLAAGLGTVLALFQAAGAPAGACGALMPAAVTAALALLGPGAWSIDARLFGWKRIEIAPRKGHDAASD